MSLMRFCSTVAAVFTLTSKAAQDWPLPLNGPDGAYTDCPCARNTGNKSLDSLFPASVQVENGQVYVSFQVGSGRVPADYGSSRCNDWDASGHSYAECQQLVRPEWCDDKWCYISKTACTRNFKESSEFPGFFYSYHTCGFLDRYFSPASHPWPSTRPLYAFAFGNEAQLSPGTGAKFLDMFLHFAAGVLPRVGIPLEDVRYRAQLSNATQRKFSSTYSGCVHDVALGNIDICLGDIWATEERQSFGTAVFIQVFSEPMLLLTTIENKEDNLWDMLLKPFIPFDWNLWGMIFSVIVATCLAMVFFEFHRNDSDFPDRSIGAAIAKSMYLSVSSFVNAGTAYTSVTLSGRVTSVGYGLFILISIATFTAETASALISKSLVQKAQTIEDVLEASASICYSAGMKTMLEKKYPRVKQLGVPMDTAVGADFASAIVDGKCSYAIVGELWMDGLWERGDHCNLTLAGSAILSFPTGYYVSEELAPYIAWAVSRERAVGAWAKVQNEYQTKSLCDSSAASGDHEDNSAYRRLDARNMLGAFLVFAGCLVVASFIRCFEIACCGFSEEDKELTNELKADAEQLKQTIELGASASVALGDAVRRRDHIVHDDETKDNVSYHASNSDPVAVLSM
eukprot:TRINITY_DN27305_c0_g1_i1.p1 TRINITY_DN27305_c0_g1~~TRINITY_DN27305_c0_g1_i1.p1  ORF type:complete len:626 (+),score=81.02 TRINITY_DN27305_c0_g1_i1:54-1931(+)